MGAWLRARFACSVRSRSSPRTHDPARGQARETPGSAGRRRRPSVWCRRAGRGRLEGTAACLGAKASPDLCLAASEDPPARDRGHDPARRVCDWTLAGDARCDAVRASSRRVHRRTRGRHSCTRVVPRRARAVALAQPGVRRSRVRRVRTRRERAAHCCTVELHPALLPADVWADAQPGRRAPDRSQPFTTCVGTTAS